MAGKCSAIHSVVITRLNKSSPWAENNKLFIKFLMSQAFRLAFYLYVAAIKSLCFLEVIEPKIKPKSIAQNITEKRIINSLNLR